MTINDLIKILLVFTFLVKILDILSLAIMRILLFIYQGKQDVQDRKRQDTHDEHLAEILPR